MPDLHATPSRRKYRVKGKSKKEIRPLDHICDGLSGPSGQCVETPPHGIQLRKLHKRVS